MAVVMTNQIVTLLSFKCSMFCTVVVWQLVLNGSVGKKKMHRNKNVAPVRLIRYNYFCNLLLQLELAKKQRDD